MDTYLMINGKKIELTEEQVKIFTEKKEEKKDVIHRVHKHDEYSSINSAFDLTVDEDDDDDLDEARFEKGNYYPTECKDLAIQDALHQELNSRLRKFTRNNGWDENVWNDFEIDKWHIDKNLQFGTFWADSWRLTKSNDIYFMSEEIAEQAIEEVIKPFIEEHPEFVW